MLARRWQELRAGKLDITRPARREKVTRLISLALFGSAFLSPQVTKASGKGEQRAGARGVGNGRCPMT